MYITVSFYEIREILSSEGTFVARVRIYYAYRPMIESQEVPDQVRSYIAKIAGTDDDYNTLMRMR